MLPKMAARAARNGMLRPFLRGFWAGSGTPSPMCAAEARATDSLPKTLATAGATLLRFVFKLMPGKMGDMRRGNGEEESPRTFVGGGFVHAAAAAAAAAAHATGIRCCRPCHWLLSLEAAQPTRDGLDEVQVHARFSTSIVSVPFGATVDPASRDGVRCDRSCPCRSCPCRSGFDVLACVRCLVILFWPTMMGVSSCREIPATFEIPVGKQHAIPGAGRETLPHALLFFFVFFEAPGARTTLHFRGVVVRKACGGNREATTTSGREPIEATASQSGSPLQVHVVRRTAHSRSRRTRAGVLLATLPS
jgi:hypothetical protein